MYQGRAVIGVMPLYDEEKNSYWMLPGYMKGLEAQGAIPLMLPLTDSGAELDYFLDCCDGFLLTGGQDVSPELYGAVRSPECGAASPERDRMDAYILKEAVKRDKAVLGICRGIQLMNAAYGGTLYQDLPTEHGSETDHHMEPPYDRAVHTVTIEPDTPLYSLLGRRELGVNSYHHQAVRQPAPCFAVMAYSEDGLPEAVYMPDRRFVWGVQWHPELSYLSDENSRKIFRAFLEAAAEQ